MQESRLRAPPAPMRCLLSLVVVQWLLQQLQLSEQASQLTLQLLLAF